MAGRKETPEDRARRDEALTASAGEAAEQAEKAAAEFYEEAAGQLGAMAAVASTPTDKVFVASAARIMLNDRRAALALRRTRQAWQSEAWDYIEEIGEVGFTLQFAANMISKVRLFPATKPDAKGDPVPVDDEASEVDEKVAALAVATLDRLKSPQGGQASLLRALDWNFETAGEAYLHGHEDDPDDPDAAAGEEEWYIRSIDEMVVQGDSFVLRTALSAAAPVRPVPATDLVIRLWDPSPRFGDLATSPMRRVLSVCENLLLLTRAMRADAMSHLNNGLLLKPEELSRGHSDPTKPDADGNTDDPFEIAIRETVAAPIEQPGSVLSVAPSVVTGKAEFLKPDVFRHMTFSRPLDALLSQWIDGLVMRLARGLNMPVEVTCADEETEILTGRGWLRHDEVRAGDEALTLNHETGFAEWKTIDVVNRFEVIDHPMVSLEGRLHSSLTTVDHRWPVLSSRGETRAWRQSATLLASDTLIAGARCADLPTEAKWSDAFVEVVAWFWTEGTYHRTGSGVVSQSMRANPEKVELIRAALTALCGPPTEGMHAASRSQKVCAFEGCGWPVHGAGLCNAHRQQRSYGVPLRPVRRFSPRPEPTVPVPAWRERPGDKESVRFCLNKPLVDMLREVMDDDKAVDPAFVRSLTYAQLELFIARSVAGDGHRNKSDGLTLRQVVRRRTDAFDLACLLSGRATRRYERDVLDGYSAAPGSHQYGVSARWPRPQRVQHMDRREIRYTGTVWCPTLANSSWLARRHGHAYFTGNTGLQETTFANAAVVKKSEWDAHGEPRMVLICEALTAGYYREALAAALAEADMDTSEADRIFVWFDPSNAISAPDPVDSADIGVERGLIREATWRRVKGFTDADEPSPDEILLSIAHEAPRMDPFMAAQLWRRTGIFPEVLIPLPANGYIDGDGNVVAAPAAPAEMAAAVVRQLVASGIVAAPRRAQRSAGHRLGARLAAIDRHLQTRLLTACEQALRRCMERAGAKVRSKVAGRGRDDAAARTAAAAPAREVCGRLGREVVTAAGIGEADLLEGAFDDLVDDFAAWTAEAQAAALDELTGAVSLSRADVDRIAAAQAAARSLGADALKASMVALAGRRLFDPTAAAAQRGEVASTVPAGVVRQAMGLAGGDAVDGDPFGTLRSSGGGPVGGVATGPDVVAETGGAERYVWDYGAAPRTVFEPHADLDGVEFDNFDDDVLANDGGWPDVPFYMPGDHDGCVCNVIPILDVPDGGSGDEGDG